MTKPFDIDELLGYVANLLVPTQIDEPPLYTFTTWSAAEAGDDSQSAQ